MVIDEVSTDFDDYDYDYHKNDHQDDQIFLFNVPICGDPSVNHSIYSYNSN